MGKQMHLNLFIHSRGHHEASWRHPKSSPKALTDISYLTDAAQTAELGLFDSIFLADTLVVNDDVAQAPRLWLEPISTLGALAIATKKIGLIATASTTYMEPFNLARQFASLDHVSAGRIGWNIVTTWSVPAGSNFGANNGIDISGRSGEAIRASASGVVVYSGSGVRGYGNLLIIKHNDDFLSAYAFNRKLFVKQGAHVKSGQKIATMGLNNQGKSILHFEIRKNGNPINPLIYLSRKKLA